MIKSLMKLVVQIPCLNEEKSIATVIKQIPKKITGIKEIEIQIIDDGSSDKTVEIAKKLNVNRIINHRSTRGLGISFSDGVEAALRDGVDILVNTDGDNQYPGKYITDLVKPILEQKADLVIADRQTKKVEHFSSNKKFFQKLGSAVVRYLSGTNVPDAVSGFRAYSREALMEINPISKFSYCIDTIVQAGKKGLKIVSVPIIINKPTRKSRLFNNIWEHIKKSTVNLFRVFIVYESFKFFIIIGAILLVPALFFILRFIYYYFLVPTESTRYLQSLILGSALLTTSIQMFALGILADLVGINRKLVEKILRYEKKYKK